MIFESLRAECDGVPITSLVIRLAQHDRIESANGLSYDFQLDDGTTHRAMFEWMAFNFY